MAINDINDTFINTPVSGDVSTNDLNPDGPAGTETFTATSQPTNGTLVFNPDGTYTYTPDTDFVGEDSFTYEVCDAGNPIACDTATVTIEVAPVPTSGNEPPVANDDTNTTEVDTPVSGTVLSNDFDPDGDTISVTQNTDPSNGTVVINPDGTYTYTPDPGFEGEDSFTYTICDDQTPQLCDTATVTIQVIPDNGNITVANDDAYTTAIDTDVSGNVTDNDNDPEGDDFTVTSNTDPANGSVTVNPDGTFTYTPNPGFVGTDQFTYTITDDNGATDTATVYITIQQTPDPGISLIKTGIFVDVNQDQCTDVNETIDYTFTVTNQGNVPLSAVSITDPLFEAPNPIVNIVLVSGDDNSDNLLDTNETWVFTATYAITQENIDAGNVTNQATVQGTSTGPNQDIVTDLSDDNSIIENNPTITTLCNSASIDLVKVGVFNNENTNQCSEIGETITYTITLTNTGNTSLENVIITDPLLDNSIPAIPLTLTSGDTDNDSELDTNETWVYTANYPINETDIIELEVDNTAVVTATDVTNGTTVTDFDEITTDLVADTTPPDSSQCEPLDETIECDGDNNELLANAWDAANIQALLDCTTDNCDDNFSVTSNYSYDNLIITCGAAGTIDVIYTLTDNSNNSSTYSAVFTIEDNTAPVIDTLPADSTINCPDTPSFATATATDACGSDFTLTFQDVTTDGDCAGEYSVTRTWTATDACGNTSTATQTINVVDETAPELTIPSDVTVECSDDSSTTATGVATATDTCSTTIDITSSDVTTPGACDGEFTITRTWIATDECGNTTSLDQVITVQDTTAPEVTNPDGDLDVTIECSDTDALDDALNLEPTVTDNGSNNIITTLVSDDTVQDPNCANASVRTRTWTFDDGCGNISDVFTQVITIVDTTAPVLITTDFDENINASCDAIPEIPELMFEDNCSANVTVVFDEQINFFPNTDDYEIIRDWTVDDGCGNTATFTQLISVTTPTIDAVDGDRCIDDGVINLFDFLQGNVDGL